MLGTAIDPRIIIPGHTVITMVLVCDRCGMRYGGRLNFTEPVKGGPYQLDVPPGWSKKGNEHVCPDC